MTLKKKKAQTPTAEATIQQRQSAGGAEPFHNHTAELSAPQSTRPGP